MTQAPCGLMAQYNLLDRLQQIEVSSKLISSCPDSRLLRVLVATFSDKLITIVSSTLIHSLTQSQQTVQFALPHQGVGCLAQLGERRPYKP